MAQSVKFNIEDRAIGGKSNNKRLRNNAKIPAVIYGGANKEMKISLDRNQFQREYAKGGIKTKLIELLLQDKLINAVTREIQFDPITDFPIHIDFQEVSKDTLVRVNVALRVINEEKSPGIRRGGVINLVYRSIPMLCPPTNIPTHINIDISGMEIGQNKHINDVDLPENVRPVDKSNFTILSIGGSSQDEEAASKENAQEK